MAEITVPAKKFRRILNYLNRIGLDAQSVAIAADLQPERLARLNPEQRLPAMHYSRLYKAAAEQMQTVRQPLPWGAGLGGESFAMMCHCVIGARTLGGALRLAQRYDDLLYPINGYRMCLLEEPGSSLIKLSYTIDVPRGAAPLMPADWDRADATCTVARASGLIVWRTFCGWLIGQNLAVREVRVDAPQPGACYRNSLARTFAAPVHFAADENTFSFERDMLERRLVHTTESLEEFLSNSVYHLIAMDQLSVSTSAAIKSLVSIELPNGMPSFSSVASMLYMSESSLRRRLQGEQTSYQAIKDAVRCEVAMDKLLHEDTRVADLAEQLGFTEASSFVRSFKSWTGQTPKSYKDNMQSLARA